MWPLHILLSEPPTGRPRGSRRTPRLALPFDGAVRCSDHDPPSSDDDFISWASGALMRLTHHRRGPPGSEAVTFVSPFLIRESTRPIPISQRM